MEVRRAGHRLAEALRLQFQVFESGERDERIRELLQSQSRGEVTLDCLIIEGGSQLVAVQLLVRQTDGTVFVWPPESNEAIEPAVAARMRARLCSEARQAFDASGGWIGQTLLELRHERQSHDLIAGGFPHVTDLRFMFCHVTSAKPFMLAAEWRTSSFVPDQDRDRFARLLERTWEATQDCPELDGTRTGGEALESHRLSGMFDPGRWFVLSDQSGDAAVLLLTAHPPDASVWEVVYLGVIPERRGSGLGRMLVQMGLNCAKTAGAEELVLAVDIRNQPALRIYEALGFQEFDRRRVHARFRPTPMNGTETGGSV